MCGADLSDLDETLGSTEESRRKEKKEAIKKDNVAGPEKLDTLSH
jgi:hypothetical protein